MAAIVTDAFRKNVAEALYEQVSSTSDSNEYYIGIGKSDPYGDSDLAVTAIRSYRDERLLRSNLQSIKKVEGVSFVIPRYNWSSGTLYSAYADDFAGLPSNSYYVLTEENEVYICLKQPRDDAGIPSISTVQPNWFVAGVQPYQSFETDDGYVWKFIYKISASRANTYLSANWMPIEYIDIDADSSTLTADQLNQLLIQKEARANSGRIYGVKVVDGGQNFTSTPTLSFVGDGSGASATVTISGRTIVKVEMENESSGTGSNYNVANVELSGGGGIGAELRPILGSTKGIGFNALDDLKASSLMFTIKPDGVSGGDFIVNQDFRQITLIKNPKLRSDGSPFDEISDLVLKRLKVTSADDAADFDAQADIVFVGQTSGAKAYVDDVDSTIIYYHQNEKTGFGTFLNEEEIIDSANQNHVAIIDSAIGTSLTSTVDTFTGEILYIENRAAIPRSTGQREDIKIIITL